MHMYYRSEDQYSSAGIVTRYGQDGLGFESRWMRDYPYPSRPAVGQIQLSI